MRKIGIYELRMQFEKTFDNKNIDLTYNVVSYKKKELQSQWLGYKMCARINNLVKEGE